MNVFAAPTPLVSSVLTPEDTWGVTGLAEIGLHPGHWPGHLDYITDNHDVTR